MPTTIALLRAVNVGGRKVSMADLRELAESLGYADVRTYIQSGNLLFTAARKPSPPVLEAAIAERFGIAVDVMLRSSADLERVILSNPFPAADISRLHVGFMSSKPKAAAISVLDHRAFEPEEFVVAGAEVYLHLPAGMARTKLPDHVIRGLGVPLTIRNWNTVMKLSELSRAA